jgi:hypothetical protein
MWNKKEKLISRAISAQRESKQIEFKESFNISSDQDWCEVLKDVVAIANSGGGIIIFGKKNNWSITSSISSKLSKLDPATVTDKIYKYTNSIYQDFEIETINTWKRKVVVLVLDNSKIPLVFCKPGTYVVSGNKQKTSFSQWTIYFRHGAKSEPCSPDDIKEVIDRNVDMIKKSWLGNIRKVVSSPIWSKIQILPSEIKASTNENATAIRITTEESAPLYRIEDPNSTHPFRGKDILDTLMNQLKIDLNSFHLSCIRKEFKIDKDRPDFFYKSTFGAPQFSKTFLEWCLNQYKKDKKFFEKVRLKYLKK